jgi:hypothetical protein
MAFTALLFKSPLHDREHGREDDHRPPKSD